MSIVTLGPAVLVGVIGGCLKVSASYHKIDNPEEGPVPVITRLDGGGDGQLLLLKTVSGSATIKAGDGIRTKTGGELILADPAATVLFAKIAPTVWSQI